MAVTAFSSRMYYDRYGIRENQLAEEAGRLRRRRKEWLEDTKKVLLEVRGVLYDIMTRR